MVYRLLRYGRQLQCTNGAEWWITVPAHQSWSLKSFPGGSGFRSYPVMKLEHKNSSSGSNIAVNNRHFMPAHENEPTNARARSHYNRLLSGMVRPLQSGSIYGGWNWQADIPGLLLGVCICLHSLAMMVITGVNWAQRGSDYAAGWQGAGGELSGWARASAQLLSLEISADQLRAT